MNKIILALGLTVAVSTGALAQSSALDAHQPQAGTGEAAIAVTAPANDRVSYNRAGNDGSPVFEAPVAGGIDYTATASIGDAAASQDRIIYHRAGNDGSPTFN
ncbi:hypothetical protein [Hoeflea sp.]|uniref:hypothetical protein n=1 Tax=Hoeflea sp. TaxID=1940281 RepID=UPI003B51ED06